MRRLIEIATQRRVTIVMFTVAIGLFGMVSLSRRACVNRVNVAATWLACFNGNGRGFFLIFVVVAGNPFALLAAGQQENQRERGRAKLI